MTALMSATDVATLRNLGAQLARMNNEGLKLYRALPTQMPFHTSLASERILRGGNRSGKSVSAAAEFASAATQMPIIGPDDKPIPHKYPIDRPLILWAIGYGQSHIADPIYELLFQKRAFKIIKDRETNLWRAWRPWEAEDLARESEVQFGPPLIPDRMIDPKGWAWEDKAARIFTRCTLKNGTIINAFTSGARPKMGVPVDLLWIDEDIEDPRHVGEWQARLSDRRGRLIWSAFPHSQNFALLNMSRRAFDDRDNPNPDVKETLLKFHENPFIPEDEKRKRLKSWDADERRARDEGDFLTDTILVYPTFSVGVHGSPPTVLDMDDKIDAVLRARNGEPPDNWTRYLILDPGHKRQAVLFAAVPPPELGDAIVLYDELYLERVDAAELAKHAVRKAGPYSFERFVIDFRAGRQTSIGRSDTVANHYTKEFTAVNLRSRVTGHSFSWGSDNVGARLMCVRELLAIQPNGKARLRIVTARTPNLQKEFTLYSKKITHKEVQDEPVPRDNDLMNCLEYLAALRPEYVTPEAPKPTMCAALRVFNDLKEQERIRNRESGGKSIHMGPVAVA